VIMDTIEREAAYQVIARLKARIKTVEAALQEATDYFVDRADITAEGDPNTEMALATSFRLILEEGY